MNEGQNAPDLRVLDERYERQGELRGGAAARTYLGKRRSDGADVMIAVVSAPNGGENNALSHLASDTQMLARISHPNVPRVLDGLWLGKEAFAVVSERVSGTSLAEVLSTGERFSFPRVASVLQRVNGVLDWARDQGVVHRGVTADNLLFEQGTHRAVMPLGLTSIPLDGVPDAGADAKTIGLLAWTMITGKPLTGDASEEALREQRPDLAKRVVADTLAMIRSKSGVAPPNVQDFLAVIAAGDALQAADVETARIQAELNEERRIERETIAAERAAERERFETEQRICAEHTAEIERRLADERVQWERLKAEEEAKLASTEQQLAAERIQFEQERVELEERNTELAAARGEVDRLKADGEQRIAAAVASAVAAAKAAMPQAPAHDDDLAYLPSKFDASNTDSNQPEAVTAGETPSWETTNDAAPGRRRWMMPAFVAGILVVLIAVAAIVNHGSGAASSLATVGKEKVNTTLPATDAGRLPRGGFMSQSSGGNVGPQVGSPLVAVDTTRPGAGTSAMRKDSLSSIVPDSARDSLARQDSAQQDSVARRERALARDRAIKRAARERDSLARRDSIARHDSLLIKRDTLVKPDTAAKTETFAKREVFTKSDTVVKRGSFVRLDSLVKRDSLTKRDSIVRPRPDTTRR